MTIATVSRRGNAFRKAPPRLIPRARRPRGPQLTAHRATRTLGARSPRGLLQLLALTFCLTHSLSAYSAEEDEKEFSAESAPRPDEMPLAELPPVPSRELSDPRPEALQAIDGILSRLISADPVIVERASREVYEAKSDWVSGIARKIDSLAERADRQEMKRLLGRARSEAREGLDADLATPDYLSVVLRHAEPDSQGYKSLVQLMASARMLRTIESTPATRELINIYVRFGEFMRIDVQRLLEDLGDRATAALIEAQRHPAEKIARWAKRQLDLRGQAIPHEAVRTEDQQALADILVALGSTRDPDAARLLISFAGTERSRVRDAARVGIVLLGEVAAWPLRDAYQDMTGRTPSRAWTWKRTARELFTEFDRMRLAQAYELFERAQVAKEAGQLALMATTYDSVLTLSPLFDQRSAMASGYLQFAQAAQTAPDQALLAARRARRIADDMQLKQQAESVIDTLNAERLRRRGLLDSALLARAVDADPSNDAARRQQAAGPNDSEKPLSKGARYAAALLICALALSSAGWILWTARRPEERTPTAELTPPIPETGDEEPPMEPPTTTERES